MKALVIAPQPFFTPRGTPFSVYYRTLVTAELGVKVDLLTYGEGQDVDIAGVRMIRIPRFGFLGQVKTGPSLLKLLLDVFLMIWTIGLVSRYRYDFVHAHEEAVFFARFLKPIFRFKLVYDMHSSLPEQLVNFNFTKSKVLITIFRRLEQTCIEAADAVITICPALSSYVEGLLKETRKHLLIENSIFDKVRTKTDGNASSSPAPKNVKVPRNADLIVYAGTLETYQGIDLLLDAFRRVADAKANVALLVVGGNPNQVTYYTEMAERNGIAAKCVFTGRVPPDLARAYTRRATLLASPRITGSNTPLKIYEQIASCIPLVATNIYSHTQVLNRDVAFLVEPTADDLADGILKALGSKEAMYIKAENAKRLYEEKYSRPVYVTKMQQLLALLR
jgi:glycosyltransferase involved in cell wall biosynthesis